MESVFAIFDNSPRVSVRIDGVERRWHSPSGRHARVLSPVQATRLVGTWMLGAPGRTIRYAAWRKNAWTWVLVDENGDERSWGPENTTDAALLPVWFVREFPWPVRTRTPISEAVALTTIREFANRPGRVSGADLVDVVVEVLEQAGMPVTT